MQTFSQAALPGAIVASALGAVVLCVVLLLYGFKSEPDDERAPARRLLVIRLGHALAVACFAAALMLSTVALVDQRRLAASVPPAIAPVTMADVQRLQAHVTLLEQRLAATESRLLEVGTRSAVVGSPTIAEPRRPAPSALRSRKNANGAAPIRPTANAPLTASIATSASSSDDLGAKLRDDWQTVKRGFQDAGREIRSSFADLGRRITQTFKRDVD